MAAGCNDGARSSSPWWHAQGGFLPEMTRREAALILGIRESAGEERVKVGNSVTARVDGGCTCTCVHACVCTCTCKLWLGLVPGWCLDSVC